MELIIVMIYLIYFLKNLDLKFSEEKLNNLCNHSHSSLNSEIGGR